MLSGRCGVDLEAMILSVSSDCAECYRNPGAIGYGSRIMAELTGVGVD